MEGLRASRRLWSVLAAVALSIVLDLAGGCTSFQAVPDTADGSAPGTSSGQQGIRCGTARCAAPDVCCFQADGGTESCTTAAGCMGAPLECITTLDCVGAGTPPGTVCCVYDDKTKLVRSTCLQGSACDPTGPQNWTCDPRLAPGSECKQPGYTTCKGYQFPAPDDFAQCAPP